MAVAQTSITSKEALSNEKVYVIKSGYSSSTTSYYMVYSDGAPDYLSATYGSDRKSVV